ncbi:hypothetical protein [Hyalangium versicolor]|uniref:hypothetical protein n=1 Tax=Hyalangium versicolor TaxID=2861190 RepID=UPI001CCD77BD|nr:hypothetical protein [Hyalangium versicolor]
MTLFHARGLAFAGLTLSTFLTLGCEAPPVVATSDRQQQTRSARIEGGVVVQGPARGNAVVFLYDAARPPPPQGTGRPEAFALIPQEELFGSELDTNTTGPFTAPFTFPLVRPGKYLLRGFIDADTCRTGAQPCHGPDFIPWYNVTAEPNVGDVGGAAVDLATGTPRVIEVREAEDGTPIPVLGATVSFSTTANVLVDRPAFAMEGAPATIEPNGNTRFFKLRARPIREGAVNLSAPVFLVRFMDENHDGAPDDANADGVPDLWPRIIVRKLADSGTGITDENDLDNDGQLDAEGMDYAHANAPADGQPDLVVLAAGVAPEDTLLQSLYADGQPLMDKVIPVPELTVAVRPLALDARNPSAPAPLQKMPSGRYSVTALQYTGQVWRVPNELSPTLAGALGLPAVEGQGQTLQVP